MKKNIFAIASILLLATGSARAQFYYYWDPFANGEKSLGVDIAFGGWVDKPTFQLESFASGPYTGYSDGVLKRSFIEPSAALVYKRMIRGSILDWGNIFRINFYYNSGTFEAVSSTNPANTLTTKYNFKSIDVTDLYLLMIPIGETVHINLGGGFAIGHLFAPTSRIDYSDGTPSQELKGNPESFSAKLELMLGADYSLNDEFTLTFSLIAHPINLFGFFGENPGYTNVGSSLYVSSVLPYYASFGFFYNL